MTEQRTMIFSGSPLNRLSWLRTSPVFLNAIIASPDARWLLFKSGNPLSTNTGSKSILTFLSTKDVGPFIGEAPRFGQGKVSGSLTKEEQIPATEAVRHRGAPIVFLGLLETATGGTGALPSSEFADPEKALHKVEGTPYFALDVADLDLEDSVIESTLKESEPAKAGTTLDWLNSRTIFANADLFTGAIFAEGRSMVDWNSRNKFCPGCGSRNHSLWGGWKLGCSSLMPWADNTGRKPCPSGKGLHNYMHPRSDPVVIMLTVDQSGDKIFLGQNNSFKGFYSALSGFIEPGETFEDAVKREMWEEAGMKVSDPKYHRGQPWPFPASMMVGFFSRADSTLPVRTDLDNELADARWFTREQVLSVLNHVSGSSMNLNKADEKKEGDPPFTVPPTTALAGVMIRDWAEGRAKFAPVSLN
ncbi:hypothetical protein GYMLUDRAFT_43316 [Collybiopsis luxurians FD-317 M1]|uniref:NAD(+) diphosphatase n=1 Tax=Collybiopsis luxurians FD-317 M1 TaxID=944289 RepID=A0A0D0BC04_9AGAR|nr:hypothetical protein GYMLUDRAFT_43316 [Collybiopsis luxurians FD-317 M1]